MIVDEARDDDVHGPTKLAKSSCWPVDGAVCARVGGLGALELAQSKRRRAHTNTCELHTRVRAHWTLDRPSGCWTFWSWSVEWFWLEPVVILEVDLEVDTSARLSFRWEEGLRRGSRREMWVVLSVLVEAPACSSCLLQSPLLRNHQTHRIRNPSSCSCYSFGAKNMDVMMLACVMVSSCGTSFQQLPAAVFATTLIFKRRVSTIKASEHLSIWALDVIGALQCIGACSSNCSLLQNHCKMSKPCTSITSSSSRALSTF